MATWKFFHLSTTSDKLQVQYFIDKADALISFKAY